MSEREPIHIKVDKELKLEAVKLFKDLDLDLTTAITLFLRKAVASESIPFQITRYNSETEETIQKFQEGKELNKYSSTEDMFEKALNE